MGDGLMCHYCRRYECICENGNQPEKGLMQPETGNNSPGPATRATPEAVCLMCCKPAVEPGYDELKAQVAALIAERDALADVVGAALVAATLQVGEEIKGKPEHAIFNAVDDLRHRAEASERERDKALSYIATLPADWHEDSSLETWFPLTAEELERTKTELAALRRLQGGEPDFRNLARKFGDEFCMPDTHRIENWLKKHLGLSAPPTAEPAKEGK